MNSLDFAIAMSELPALPGDWRFAGPYTLIYEGPDAARWAKLLTTLHELMAPPRATMGAQGQLKAIRVRYGWTQGQAAKRLGISRNTYLRWENGMTKKVPLDAAFKLSENPT